MDTPTVLEVETEREAVASVLGAVPGVAVDDTAEPGTDPGSDANSTGLTDRLGALWRQWGLLGTGVSLITLGVATVGFWVYRRQSDEESGETGTESPVPADTGDIAETPAPSLSAADVPPTESVEDVPSTAADQQPTDDAAADVPTETALATSPEHSDDPETAASEPSDEAQAASEASEAATDEATDADEAGTRPTANVDPAPLLGAAFLIVTGAVGRRLARDRVDEM